MSNGRRQYLKATEAGEICRYAHLDISKTFQCRLGIEVETSTQTLPESLPALVEMSLSRFSIKSPFACEMEWTWQHEKWYIAVFFMFFHTAVFNICIQIGNNGFVKKEHEFQGNWKFSEWGITLNGTRGKILLIPGFSKRTLQIWFWMFNTNWKYRCFLRNGATLQNFVFHQ